MTSTGTFKIHKRRPPHGWIAPKSREWFIGFLATTGALILLYAAAAFFWGVTPARGAGLVFGIVAAVIFFAVAALNLRKRFKHKPLGRTFHWLQFHIYAGTLTLVLVLMHTGFGLPNGFLTWCILILTLIVCLSGVVGAMLQKWIPHALSKGLQVEAIYERIPELIDRLRAESETLIKGASQPLMDFYKSELAPALAGPQPSSSFLLDVTGGRLHRMVLFTHVSGRLSASEKEKLDDLRQIFIEKNQLDAQMSLQRIMRFWLYFHVPTSTILLALVVVHIGATLWY